MKEEMKEEIDFLLDSIIKARACIKKKEYERADSILMIAENAQGGE